MSWQIARNISEAREQHNLRFDTTGEASATHDAYRDAAIARGAA